MPYSDIPEELKRLQQWCCWRYEDIGAKKPTKIPFNPRTSRYASVDDNNTWVSFEEAVGASSKYAGIGFIFTDNDPYAVVDLDDSEGNAQIVTRQIEIFKQLDSYSEISPSKSGLHIIVKAKVPAGRKRNNIEIYSSSRYVTFTGNIHNNKPIRDCQDEIMAIWQSMGNAPTTHTFQFDAEQKESDEEVIAKASSAYNKQKFIELYAGHWQSLYPSQSEADFALIDIIAFYTHNKNQIIRVFQSSELGKRDKAKRSDYLNWMINRAGDRQLPPVDIEGFKIALQNKTAEQSELPLNEPPKPKRKKKEEGIYFKQEPVSLPPGLMGEIAQFIYAAAPRPVPEIALAASIGLMAGICGRAYNISATGLNQYIILIASTGTGKEGMASGIDKLMNAIRFQVPTSVGIIGPSNIASGQSLIKHLSKTSACFVSILGEFGLRLQQVSAMHASSAERSLKIMLLDLYNKSGHGQILRPSIYADTDKNTTAVESPAFSILAESTPSTFFGALNEEMINEGLLPRFMIIEYNGARPALNEDHQKANPPNWLVDKLATLAAQCETISHHKRVINVQTNSEAGEILKDFDKLCDLQINSTTNEIMRHLWSRAHMKVLKISALVAVGVNPIEPIVTREYVKWAMGLAEKDIITLTNKFEEGNVGGNAFEVRQQFELIRMIKEFLLNDDVIERYNVNKKLYENKVIPYQYLSRRLIAQAAFRNDRNGSTNAIKRALQILLDSDKLREISKNELAVKYGTTQRSFVVSDLTILD